MTLLSADSLAERYQIVDVACPVAGCVFHVRQTAARGRELLREHTRLAHPELSLPRRKDPAGEEEAPAGEAAAGEEMTRPGGRPRGSWTRETAVEALQRFALQHDGRTPTQKELLAANGLPNQVILRRLFGTQNNAVEAAGLTPRPGRPGRRPRQAAAAPAIAPPSPADHGKQPDGEQPDGSLLDAARELLTAKAQLAQAKAEFLAARRRLLDHPDLVS